MNAISHFGEVFEALTKAGQSPEEALETFKNYSQNLATKADLQELLLTTKADIQDLREATKEDIQKLKISQKYILWVISYIALVGTVVLGKLFMG